MEFSRRQNGVSAMYVARSAICVALMVLALSQPAQSSIHQELRQKQEYRVAAKLDLRAVASLDRPELRQPELVTGSINIVSDHAPLGAAKDPLTETRFPPVLGFLMAAMGGLIAIRRMSHSFGN
jgi:hypothetical protein